MHTLIRFAVLVFFRSYTVLRKDVREMNSDCPPKADAGLKQGEFKVKHSEVNHQHLTKLVHSVYRVPDICVLVCVLTHLAENARRACCSETD